MIVNLLALQSFSPKYWNKFLTLTYFLGVYQLLIFEFAPFNWPHLLPDDDRTASYQYATLVAKGKGDSKHPICVSFNNTPELQIRLLLEYNLCNEHVIFQKNISDNWHISN